MILWLPRAGAYVSVLPTPCFVCAKMLPTGDGSVPHDRGNCDRWRAAAPRRRESRDVRVLRHLGNRQLNVFHAGRFADNVSSEPKALAPVNGRAALQVRQLESLYAIASVSCAQDAEQRRILLNTQSLAIAEGPAARCKIAREHTNFTDIWL